jgi:hypothetical protein
MRLTPSFLLPALALGAVAGPAPAQQPRTVLVGRVVADSLTDRDPVTRSRKGPYHVWSVEGRRGQRLAVELGSSDFDAYLILRDAEGFVIGRDDDSGEGNAARLRVILPRDGRYQIIATSYNETGRGAYTLGVSGWETPEAPAAGAAADLAVGQTKDGVLEPGDEIAGDGPFQDRWTFQAAAGARLRLELRSNDFDAYLIVLGPDGRAVGSDDDGLGDNDASLAFRAEPAGRYTALATSYGDEPKTGAYTIALVEERGEFAEPGEIATIAPGETREGRLETGDRFGSRGFEDRWTFTARQGQLLRVDVGSAAFDAYAVLRQAATPVDSNDDGGDGTDARIMTVAPTTGTYTVVVSALSENRSGGRYTIALATTAPPAAPGQTARLAPGQRLAGRLEPGDRVRPGGGFEDVWEFEARAGQDITIEMRSGAFDAYLELRDARDRVIAENDDGLGEGTDAFLLVHLDQGGRYRVVARGYGERESTGFYELALGTAAPAAPAGTVRELLEGQAVVGRLESGDSLVGDSTYADVFLFRPSRAGEVVIDLRSGDFDAYLLLQDAAGRTLASDDDGGSGRDSRLRFAVTAGQTYRILANSYGEERATGAYRLAVRFAP